jgi:hypothetical protein
LTFIHIIFQTSHLAIVEEFSRKVSQAVSHGAIHDGLTTFLWRLEQHTGSHAEQVTRHPWHVAKQVRAARA